MAAAGAATGGGVVERCRGARAAETRVLEEIAAWRQRVRAEPGLLRRPLLVVVPSGALRAHLAARAVEEAGGALLGVTIQTLWGAARTLLEHWRQPPRGGAELAGLLARRESAREGELTRELEDLEDGLGLAAASIRDLIHAGLAPGDGDLADGLPRTLTASREGRRAAALVSAAARASAAQHAAGVEGPGDVAARAAEEVERRGADDLPWGPILVHGFADATGQSARLLRALGRQGGARVLVDVPLDPAREDRLDRGAAFVERFAQGLDLPAEADPRSGAPPPPRLGLFDASGREAEMREVARRIGELLEQGARAESIGVVARRLHDLALPLRVAFTDRGVPFSGGEEPPGLRPLDRRLGAALELLERGPRGTVDRWLEARDRDSPLVEGTTVEEARLALRCLGAVHLGEVAALDLDHALGNASALMLPVRAAVEAEGDDEREPSTSGERRSLPREALQALVERAGELLRLIGGVDRPANPKAATLRVATFLREGLDWSEGQEPAGAVLEELSVLGGRASEIGELEPEELLRLLRELAAAAARRPLGGAGGGVQVLDVARARGLTFDHLFLVGVGRDVFPRVANEDPLLGDRVRGELRRHLPDLHLKAWSSEEESHLFAELLSSAARVTISWQRADDEGRQLSPSAYVTRLIAERRTAIEDVHHVPRLAERALAGRHPLGARESLRLAGLRGGRSELQPFLELALEEGRGSTVLAAGPEAGQAAELARARLTVLAEVEPDPATRAGRAALAVPGPYLGLVGDAVSEDDPRARAAFVTKLERVARCPWQAFLTRVLRLEPAPDPAAALPGVDRRLIGSVVHATIDGLVTGSLPAEHRGRRDLDAALGDSPVEVAVPAEGSVERALQRATERVARDEGLHLAGLRRALGAAARPYVQRAVELVWAGGPLAALGVEVQGTASPGIGRRDVHFRADLVASKAEAVSLVDLKTGKPLSTGSKPETRRKHLRDGVARGDLLQAAAYARGDDRVAYGAYLYVRPDVADEHARAELPADDEAVVETFPRVATLLQDALERGTLFPRLVGVNGKEPDACRTCEVSDACLRGDTGARRRLEELARAGAERRRAGKTLEPAGERVVRLFYLGHESDYLEPREEEEAAP